MSGKRTTRTIKVDYLARVEGEGGLTVTLRDGRVDDVQLRIFEPPRFFEAFLRGRGFAEVPDVTARICGICPIAYQMSAVHAVEAALGIRVEGALRALRRLVYCGEWIESHALHVYMLHAPDFLGYADAIAMAADHREAVQRGLRLKKAGNEVVRVLGGREIHPVNVRVGGFHRVPARQELAALRDPLLWARDAAVETVRWVAGFETPDFEHPYEFVALRHPADYPMNEGRIVSTGGIDVDAAGYESIFVEEQVPYSNALHSIIAGRGPYLVGPLARYALNFDRLSPLAQQAAREAGLGHVCRNPFRSIVVRAVEILQACDEAIGLIDGYEPPARPYVPGAPRAGTGCAATEAPRGVLYHRYRIDGTGAIEEAKIVPPTSQNLKMIEADLARFVDANLGLARPELTWRCEQAIRSYDPCISCATHFLTLDVKEA